MTWRPTEATLFLEKAAAPAVTDDQNEGYLVGDIWIDETNDLAYLNLDVTVGAAVWKHVSLEEAAIDHTAILNIGTTTHADIDTHIGNADIHFLEGAIDHTNILSIGLTSHADIDTAVDELTAHVLDGTIHFDQIGELSDVVITGPADKDLLQYDTGTTKWVDRTLAEAGVSAVGHAHNDSYFTEAEHLDTSAGAADAGKPIKLDAAGHVDASMMLAIQGDATEGRVIRCCRLTIADGTDASTLKCTLSNVWNGDTIAETNNVALDATTGDWSLSADGKTLTIESSGLSGTVMAVISLNVAYNTTGIVTNGYAAVASGDLVFIAISDVAGIAQDLTAIMDTAKTIQAYLTYITTA